MYTPVSLSKESTRGVLCCCFFFALSWSIPFVVSISNIASFKQLTHREKKQKKNTHRANYNGSKQSNKRWFGLRAQLNHSQKALYKRPFFVCVFGSILGSTCKYAIKMIKENRCAFFFRCVSATSIYLTSHKQQHQLRLYCNI